MNALPGGQGFQPQIILLREGTDASQGKAQLLSNISACMAVVDVVRTTLGPRGMDKLIHDDKGVTISNDGATIMRLLQIVHPAAKSLVEISMSQDSEVGDGTTSVVVIAGELMRLTRQYIEDGVHPQSVIKYYRQACAMAVQAVKDMSISIEGKDEAEKRVLLERCAATSLNSKLLFGERDFFSKMAVDAVMHLDADLRLDMIGIKKVTGGSMRDSLLVDGVAFKKTFSYAGFEQQPKSFDNPKILLLNVELELKNEKENAEIRLDDPEKYQSIVDAEWKIIYDKLQHCVDCGAKIVLSRLPIGDLGTQFFADRDIFCAGRVPDADLRRVATATGAQVQSTTSGIIDRVLGSCNKFEERQLGNDRYNLFTGCPGSKTSTIILRGGSEAFIDEAERSLHDAIMIVRRALKAATVVPGGGAVEMECSRILREHSRTVAGKGQLFFSAFAKTLEVIPRQLADNSGFDSTDVLNKLRQKHAMADGSGKHFGVDCYNGGITDTYASFVWEPSMVKINAYAAATEATNLILSIDETVRNPESEKPGNQAMRGRGRGRGAMPGMRGMRGRGGR